MKAIIMAGGEGSRLRPLTCDRPKPLTSIMNRPVMEHIIKLLKKHGITEIGVTLQYLPDAIKDHFGDGQDLGVRLHYFIEETPLGTAGSVKNAEDFLDDTFLVISGDALTDFDLTSAYQYHVNKGALATLVLTRVDSPLEYGVVITDDQGAITQFLEKPSWGEVFSDTVNTGIYILESEVLKYFQANKKFDFSQDLFPMLLRDKQPMYGCVMPGYWCDIGNLQQYCQAHFDVLERKVDMEMPGIEVSPGIWLEPGVDIHPEAKIEAPVYIGANSQIGRGVLIGSNSVIGDNCVVEDGATLKRSILWDNVKIGLGSELRGSVLCNRVNVKGQAKIFEGSVVGDDCLIREHSMVKPNIKIWPGKIVERGAIVRDSVIWGTRTAKAVFGLDGAGGLANQDLTPEYCSKLASAFGSIFSPKSKIAISCDAWPAAEMMMNSVVAGLMSAGIQVVDMGTMPTPVSRHLVGKMDVVGGMHAKRCGYLGDKTAINIFNANGTNIGKAIERKVENLLAREGFRRVPGDQVLTPLQVKELKESYLRYLAEDVNKDTFKQRRLKMLIAYPEVSMADILPPLLQELGCEAEYLHREELAKGWGKEDLASFVDKVRKKKVDLGVFIDNTGERLILVDDQGAIVSEELLMALITLVLLKDKPGGTVTVPVTAPQVIEELAERYQGKVVRTKTALQVIMEQMLAGGQSETEEGLAQFFMNFDALYALIKILEHKLSQGVGLAKLLMDIPQFYMSKREIECPWEAKGKVMRQLIEEQQGKPVELLDGIKVVHEEGWALVLPDSEEPVCRVYSESYNMEMAESLTDMYVSKINQIKESSM